MPLIHIEIDTPLTFTRFEAGKLDAKKPGYYPGVLVIEKGAAKGHFAVNDGGRVVNYDRANPEHKKLQKYQIIIGDETLDDVVSCGVDAESTKCKLDHGATVRDIVGDYASFRRDGDQVRADLTLMDSTPHREYIVELFKKFSKKVGNSIDFDYSYEISGDVAIARCRKLNSVDLVDAPAATKSLFTENPTQPPKTMLTAEDLTAIGGLIDTKLTAHKTEVTTTLSALSKRFDEGDDKKDADDKKEKKDDEDKGGEMSAAKMGEIASKAALAAVESAFPKASREQFAKLGAAPGKSKFEELVDGHIALGASRGIAVQRVARDHKDVYNAHMSAVNAPQTGTL